MEGLATGKDPYPFVPLNNPAFIQPTFQVLYPVRLSPQVAAALQESNTGNYRILGIEDRLDKSIRQRRPLTTGRKTIPIVAPTRLLLPSAERNNGAIVVPLLPFFKIQKSSPSV